MNFNIGRTTLRALKSMFVEVSGYNPIFNRPYEANVNDRRLIDKFMDLTDDGTSVNPASMASVATQIIAPSATPANELSIVNGIPERRLVFMIAIEIIEDASVSRYPKVVIINGYTDICDVSWNNHFNPDTRMYINQITEVNTATGTPRVTDISHLMGGYMYENFGRETYYHKPVSSDTVMLMRPSDVIFEMEQTEYDDNIDVFNSTNRLKPTAIYRSRRSNGLASRFLDDVVRTTVNSDLERSPTAGISDTVYKQARIAVGEKRPMDNHLIARLKRYPEFTRGGYISYSDLCFEVNELDQKSIVSITGKVQKNGVYHDARASRVRDTNAWSGADNETIAATIIAQSLPAIMASNLVTYLSCSFTNETLDGRPSFTINTNNSRDEVGIATFGDFIDARRQVQRIQFLVETELLPILTNNGEMAISVVVEMDLQVDAFIEVSIDGGEYVPYCMPTFCDAITSPVVTDNHSRLSDIAYTLKEFTNTAILGADYD